jgi:hypothetical protein
MLMPPYAERFPEVSKKCIGPFPVRIPHVQYPAMKPNRAQIMPSARQMRFIIVDLTILSHLTLESQKGEGWEQVLRIPQVQSLLLHLGLVDCFDRIQRKGNSKWLGVMQPGQQKSR